MHKNFGFAELRRFGDLHLPSATPVSAKETGSGHCKLVSYVFLMFSKRERANLEDECAIRPEVKWSN